MDDRGHSIAVDASGDLYVTGYFNGTVDFDPGAATYNFTAVGDDDAFVLKMDADGNFVWAEQFGGPQSEYGYSVDIDDVGNVYSCGYFLSTVDFDPGAATYDLSSEGYFDIYISKLDASGNFVWAKSIGAVGEITEENSKSLKVDGSGNVFVTGSFSDTVDFDPGAAVHNLITIDGSYDSYVLKLNTDGEFVWAKNMGGDQGAGGESIALDIYGNVYTTGGFFDTCDFDPGVDTSFLITHGYNDIFLSKIDAAGNFVWAKNMGGGSSDVGLSIAVDDMEKIYTTGYFGGTAFFDTSLFLVTSAGFNDAFIFMINTPHASSASLEDVPEFAFKLYPNPGKGDVHIEFGKKFNNIHLGVISTAGQLIYENEYSDEDHIELYIDQPPGIYFVQLTVEGTIKTYKIVKE